MTERIVPRSFFCLNTARKLPVIEARLPKYYPELLPNPPKKKSSNRGTGDYPNHYPSHFPQKYEQLTAPLIEVQILPITFSFHCPEKKKDRTKVLSLI